jgi:hypothetical protein
MDRMDHLQAYAEVLEQQTEHLKHQTHALEAHTRMVERRQRGWRDLASSMVVLSLLSLALPSSIGADAQSATLSYRFDTVDVPFPGDHTTCSGINNSGVLTGLYLDPRSQDVGFMKVGGKFTLLPLLNPHAINSSRHFTGWYDSRAGLQGFLHTGTEFLTIHFPLSNLTEALGLNDNDEVVGNHRDSQGTFHSFLYRDGTYTTVDPPLPRATGSGATGINNDGIIVGGFDEHGYIDDHGIFTQLDVPGASFTLSRAINNDGVIAGVYCVGSACHGFTLDDGNFTTVAVPGAILTDISGINDHGVLCGHYVDVEGKHHGFVAKPGRERVARR